MHQALVFELVGGGSIRILNGRTAFDNGLGDVTPVCAADVSCSSLMVDAGDAEGLIARAAEALEAAGHPVPPQLERRRLNEAWNEDACLDLYPSAGGKICVDGVDKPSAGSFCDVYPQAG